MATTYAYDAAGNATVRKVAGDATTLTWSYENEVLLAETSEGLYTMTYDGDRLRRQWKHNTVTTNYLWDGAQVLLETGYNDVTKARNALAPFGFGGLVSQRRADATPWYHCDALGSMRAMTDSSGADLGL